MGEIVERQAEVHLDETEKLPYCLVDVAPNVIATVLKTQPRLAGRFDDRRGPTKVKIGVGDVISVTLYESGAGGLFFSLEGGLRQGNYITLPNQEVDSDGNISIPYAGSIRARGRTVVEIQNAIVNALKNRALEPQAVVSVVDQRASLVTVLGEVNGATRIKTSASGERILDVISRAGGPKNQGMDTWVMLERDGRVAAAPFEAVIRDPANNIYVRAHDTIYLFKEPQTFTAFGAVQRQGQHNFDAWRLTLAEAMGKAGGLIDNQADPGWVLIYRSELRKTVEELNPKCAVTDGKIIPVIYKVNLRDPAAYFLTTHFPMRDKDVLFISNARSVEVTKFLAYVRAMTSTASSIMQTGITGYSLRDAILGTNSTAIITTTTPIP